MPPVVVTAPRPDARSDVFSRPGFVARVDMTPRAGRVEDLSTVLSQLVGVRVTQYGGLGSFATVSIRGSSSSQVKTYLDGMPIDDPYLGVTNLSDLPLGGVQHIDVYRGFSPAQLGGSAIGGAVNLVTRSDTGRDALLSALDVHESGGSFDTRRHSGSVWLRPGPVRLFAHGTWEESSGDFAFDDNNGTPANPDDDDVATRVNNDFTGWNAMLRASLGVAPVAEFSAAYYDASREQGVPGLGSFQSTTARSDRQRRMGQLRAEGTPLFDKQLRWWTNAHYQRSHERFVDRDADVSLVAQDTDNRIDAYGGNARTRWTTPWLPLALEATFAGEKQTYHPVSHLPTETEGPDRWRHATTTALGADLYLFNQSLVVTGTQRFEHHTDEFFAPPRFPWLPPTPEGRVDHDATTPSVGARWQPLTWLTVKGNVGRYYRLPTFLELFGNTGSVTGNSELEPEEGDNRDVGVVVSVPSAGAVRSLLLEVSWFDNQSENLILFFPNSQYTTKPTNIGAARIRGFEASLAGAWENQLDWSLGYTRLDSEDTSDIPYYNGNQLPSRPGHEVNAALGGTWRALRLGYELHYIGANWLDRANLNEAPTRTLHGAVATIRIPVDGLSFTFEARNLSDERAVDVAGYPLPGRSFYSTLSYQY